MFLSGVGADYVSHSTERVLLFVFNAVTGCSFSVYRGKPTFRAGCVSQSSKENLLFISGVVTVCVSRSTEENPMFMSGVVASCVSHSTEEVLLSVFSIVD